MGRWTAEHSRFLKFHEFSDPRSQAFNATGLTRREYQAALSREGKLFAYGIFPCKNGHTLRTAGGCPECNSQYLSYARHNVSPGYVYIARSNSTRLIKVGLSSDPKNRMYIARLEGYADIWDWVVRDFEYAKEMGRLEAVVKRSLSSYRIDREWVRNGNITKTKEVFSCTLKLAREILHREAARN